MFAPKGLEKSKGIEYVGVECLECGQYEPECNYCANAFEENQEFLCERGDFHFCNDECRKAHIKVKRGRG